LVLSAEDSVRVEFFKKEQKAERETSVLFIDLSNRTAESISCCFPIVNSQSQLAFNPFLASLSLELYIHLQLITPAES